MALCVLEGFESYGSLTGSDLVNAIKMNWLAPDLGSDWAVLIDGPFQGKALEWVKDQSYPAIIFPVSITALFSSIKGFCVLLEARQDAISLLPNCNFLFCHPCLQ